MSLKRQYLDDCIAQIKEHLNVTDEKESEMESKDIYLQKGEDVLGLHEVGFSTETGFQPIEAWCNAYDENFKFLGSIYRIHQEIEKEAEELKRDGWTVIDSPKKQGAANA